MRKLSCLNCKKIYEVSYDVNLLDIRCPHCNKDVYGRQLKMEELKKELNKICGCTEEEAEEIINLFVL